MDHKKTNLSIASENSLRAMNVTNQGLGFASQNALRHTLLRSLDGGLRDGWLGEIPRSYYGAATINWSQLSMDKYMGFKTYERQLPLKEDLKKDDLSEERSNNIKERHSEMVNSLGEISPIDDCINKLSELLDSYNFTFDEAREVLDFAENYISEIRV